MNKKLWFNKKDDKIKIIKVMTIFVIAFVNWFSSKEVL